MGIFNKNNCIKNGDYTYYINLDKLKEVCLTSSSDIGAKEVQIIQTYEPDDMDGLGLSQKIEHETKSLGGNLNAMVYEILKLLIISLLEVDEPIKEFKPTFSNILAINTLLSWGVLEKIE